MKKDILQNKIRKIMTGRLNKKSLSDVERL
jgi:hypothetical protein